MTYCLAIQTDHGIVFASDSRTNAGVDNVNTYSKMHSYIVPGERCFVILAAGNLGTTQAVINTVQRDFQAPGGHAGLHDVEYLFEAAEYLGDISYRVKTRHSDEDPSGGVDLGATFIIGGQIKGKPPAILMVYPEGNYLAPSEANPYLQIGETKYGKPILDRIINPKTSLVDAARCALVSIDSTMRSNVSVGPPIELAIYQQDALDLQRRIRLDSDSAYYEALRSAWASGLSRVFRELPRFDWESTKP